MSKKAISRKKESTPEWDMTPDDVEVVLNSMADYFNHGINGAMLTLTRIMWEMGHAGALLQAESKYGDNAIQLLCDKIHKGTSWVYECIKMYEAYGWEEIKDKFLKAGIPASSIARLGSIKDEGARNYVEDKLIKGDITYEDIGATKKEYESITTNPDVSHSEIGDGAEQTLEERNASASLPDDDPNNVAAGLIRSFAGSETRALQERKVSLENKTYERIDQLDVISDSSLYDISANRLSELAMAARDLIVVLTNIAESIELKTGSKAEQD